MNARELRSNFIEFFQTKEHLLHASAPLVPIDVTGKLDESLLFTGAGMVQFKPYFRGTAKPPHPRLVNSQKCVRAVDIEEVGNPSHLTFFEMLGNFSFGDYFKKEAIEWAWEFLTSAEWLNLSPRKLCVTVFESDDEAYALWADIWQATGFDPATRIHRMGEEKNYWPAGAFSSGPPGPCGPCSEIFYLMVPENQLTGDFKRDDEAGRWLEIWNLVFMQYEWKGELKDPAQPSLGYRKLGMDPLPAPCIDTGSGLERTAAAIEGLTDVYQTDVFLPIVEKICSLSGEKYYEDPAKTRAIRIIADHMRTACFCIADGILPANSGRGYVLRRLIRRSVLKGQRLLGFDKPFLEKVFPSVVDAMGDPYVELKQRADVIVNTLMSEEEAFRRTLASGMDRFARTLESIRSKEGIFPGDEAFYLHDTFGFPLEVTQELADEQGLTVDVEGFHRCMAEAQARSRSAQGVQELFAGKQEALVLTVSPDAKPFTEFVGYETTKSEAKIVQISPRFDDAGLTTGEFQVCLDRTPFYPEGGGQVGDTGRIYNDEFELEVTDTWQELGLIWHDCALRRLATSPSPLKGLTPERIMQYLNTGMLSKPVIAEVDALRRKHITRNHTATHLLHATLRNVLGKHVTQAGSLVAPDRLRFDFTHREPMRIEEIDEVEKTVNRKIAEAIPVVVIDNVPLDEARRRGAMMLFGEKYGDTVRMIQINDYSLELCGGCHVNNTAEIGLFKVVHESSSASGVRRIEAVTGYGAYEWARNEEELVRETAKKLKASPQDLPKMVEKLQEQLREVRRERDRLLSSAGPREIESNPVGPFLLKTQIVSVGGPESAKLAADRLVEQDPNAVALVALNENGKLMLFCKVGKLALEKGAHAGNIVRQVAKVAGGGGGGSAQFAQAGCKDANKLNEAFEAAKNVLIAIGKGTVEDL